MSLTDRDLTSPLPLDADRLNEIHEQLWVANEQFRAQAQVQNGLIQERVYDFAAPYSVLMQHQARYSFVTEAVADKDVLDVACGSGYGSYGMFALGRARSVMGADLDADAVRYARARYAETIKASAGRLRYVCTDACAPWTDETFDVITSFETIEHVPAPDALLDNLGRMLRSDGTFYVSSPIRESGTLKDRPLNPFHIREWSLDEFVALLREYYETVDAFGQVWVLDQRMGRFRMPGVLERRKLRKGGVNPMEWPAWASNVYALDSIPEIIRGQGPRYVVLRCRGLKRDRSTANIRRLAYGD
jgi:2-polyprenyl-3-methyl-5-hydroxy-6-metoxy-1,4-benzoquinol methylase